MNDTIPVAAKAPDAELAMALQRASSAINNQRGFR
jgi:hypothetical protein